MSWLQRNANAVQAVIAASTPILAILAIVGVYWQIDASRTQAEAASAREIYRELVSISMERPELTDPGRCPAFSERELIQYGGYMEYLLYTAEQVLNVTPEWGDVFQEHFENHADFMCTPGDWTGYSPPVQSIIATFQSQHCSQLSACPVAVD